MTDAPTCQVCADPLDDRRATCLRCVSRVRADLAAILDGQVFVWVQMLYGTPASDGSGRHASGDPAPLMGGTGMDLLGPGSATGEALDGMSPLGMLGSWERMWRDELGHPETTTAASLSTVVGYLSARADYASECLPAFGDFVAEVHAIRMAIDTAGKRQEQIDKGAGCLDCGKPLIRHWGASETFDWWECQTPGCHRTYTAIEYRNALADAHRKEGLSYDARLTVAQLADRFKSAEGTVRSALSKCRVRRAGTQSETGRALYRLGDAAAACATVAGGLDVAS